MPAKRIFDKMQRDGPKLKKGLTPTQPSEKIYKKGQKRLQNSGFRGNRPHCYIMATMGQKLPFTSKLTQRNADFEAKDRPF